MSSQSKTINFNPSEVLGITAALLTVTIWAGYLASSRAGITSGLSGMDIAFIRISVSGLIMAPFALYQLFNKRINFRWIHICVLTCLIGPPFVFISAGGYAYTPLAHGAIITPAFFTIGGLIFARYLLNDTVSNQAKIGVGLIFTGLLLVAGAAFFEFSPIFLIGDIMFVIGGLMWALTASLQKKWNLQPMDIASFVSVLGAVVFIPYYLATHSLEPINNLSSEMLWFLIIVQGVLSGVVALIAFTKAVVLLGAARASLFPTLVPAIAILIGIPITGEIPDNFQWAGLCIVTTGLVIAVIGSRK